MKNEIKKILLQVENKTLKGLVVIRENEIKTYGYGKISNEELLNEYSNLISELKEQNKDELKDLTGQEAVNKLYILGKLEYSSAKIITKITNHIDASENPVKFIVNSTEGQEEIKLADCYDEKDYMSKLKDKLVEMCNTYNIELDSEDDITNEFFDNLEKLGLYEDKQEGKIVEKASPVAKEKSKKEVLNDAKIKNFVGNHKVLSGLIAAGILFTLIKVPGCHKIINKLNNTKDGKNDNNIEEQMDYVVEELPTVEPLEYFSEIAFLDMDEYKDIDSNTVLVEKINGKQYDIYDDYYSNTETLNEIRNKNMSEIANYIQSINLDYVPDRHKPIRKNGMYIYHENLFDYDLRDKAYVKYFSMIGNQIIKSAYEDDYFRGMIDNSVKSAEEVVRLIENDEPLEVYICGERQCLYFSELSREAKEMVLNIAWTNNLPLTNTITYNGNTQDDISDIILDKANELGMIK